MINRKFILSICLILGIYMFAFPSYILAEAGWTDYVKISELVPTARGYYEVKLSVKINPSGCRENIWFYQNYKRRGSDKMFETLLEGLQSGNKVRVYVTGICNVNGYSEFTAVGILP